MEYRWQPMKCGPPGVTDNRVTSFISRMGTDSHLHFKRATQANMLGFLCVFFSIFVLALGLCRVCTFCLSCQHDAFYSEDCLLNVDKS